MMKQKRAKELSLHVKNYWNVKSWGGKCRFPSKTHFVPDTLFSFNHQSILIIFIHFIQQIFIELVLGTGHFSTAMAHSQKNCKVFMEQENNDEHK
jgi:hypothetical protein